MLSTRWLSCLRVAGFVAISAPAAFGQSGERTAESPSYGTSSRIQYHVGFAEFAPSDSAMTFGMPGLGVIGRTATGSGLFWAHPHLPTGALLASFELDYCDSDAAAEVTLALYDCDLLGTSCAALDAIATGGPATPGCAILAHDLTGHSYTMQNNSRQLVLSASIPAGSTSLQGALLAYTLQVSPAPATATFSDVPTTNPQFRFVEALVAAGITAGCGGGKYCPDVPVTRGQMAVFLAVTLGLHFPN